MKIQGRKGLLKTYLLCTLLLLTIPRQAFAYLDAGTGSYIIQMLIAVVVGGLFIIKMWWKKIIALFRGLFNREN
jgi:hypothetical protein